MELSSWCCRTYTTEQSQLQWKLYTVH